MAVSVGTGHLVWMSWRWTLSRGRLDGCRSVPYTGVEGVETQKADKEARREVGERNVRIPSLNPGSDLVANFV